MKMRFFISIALGFLAGLLPAQETPQQVIDKMRATYDNARSYSMQVSLGLYTKASDVSAFSTSNGTVKVAGDSYFSSILGKTVLVDDDYEMILDEKQKIMLVADAPVHTRKEKSNTILDSSLYTGMQMKFLEHSASLDRIEISITNEESGYRYIRLKIDPETHTLTEVEYIYRNSSQEANPYEKVVIRYSAIQLNGTIPASTFSHTAYFTKNGNVLAASATYKTFQLIDQRNKNLPVIK